MLRHTHPAVLVTAGCLFILLFQLFPVTLLAVCAPCLVLLAGCLCLQRWWRIVRRLRFIFLALLILFAWQTPGRLIWPVLGELSPTWDGVVLAYTQAMRLIGIASIVALLMHVLTPAAWITGIYSLSAPLRYLGFSPERFAIRLHLVLAGIEQQSPQQQGLKDWQILLDDQVEECRQMSGQTDSDHQTWVPQILQRMDYVCLCVMLTLVVGAGWFLCKA